MKRHFNKALLATALAGALAACTTTNQPGREETPEQRRIRQVEATAVAAINSINALEAQVTSLSEALAKARIPNTPSAIARVESSVSALRHEFDLSLVRLTLEEDVRRASISIIDSTAQLQANLDRRYTNAVNAAYRDAIPLLAAAKTADIAPIMSTLSAQAQALAEQYQNLGNQVSQLRKGALVRAPQWLAQNPAQYQRDVAQSYNSVKSRIDAYGSAEPVSPLSFAAALAQLRGEHLDYADSLARAMQAQEARITRDIDDLEFSFLYQLVQESIITEDSLFDVYHSLGFELDTETRSRIAGELGARAYTDRKVQDGVAPVASETTALAGRATKLENRTTAVEARTGALETRANTTDSTISTLNSGATALSNRVGTLERAPPTIIGTGPDPQPPSTDTPRQLYLEGRITFNEYERRLHQQR